MTLRRTISAAVVPAVAVLGAAPANADDLCSPAAQLCAVEDDVERQLAPFTRHWTLDDPATGVLASCRTYSGSGSQTGFSFTVSASAVVRSVGIPAVFGTSVVCSIFADATNWGGAAGSLLGPAAVGAGTTRPIPFASVPGSVMCVKASIAYSDGSTTTVYSTWPGCPAIW